MGWAFVPCAEYVLEHWLLDPDASDQEIDDARHEVELRRAEFLDLEGADGADELPRRLVYRPRTGSSRRCRGRPGPRFISVISSRFEGGV